MRLTGLFPQFAPEIGKPAVGFSATPGIEANIPAGDTVHFSAAARTRKRASTQAARVVQKPIRFDAERQVFTLSGKNMEYHLQITPDGELRHLYWGKPVGEVQPELLPFNASRVNSWQPALDIVPREYPDFGRGDYRTPAVQVFAPGSGQLTSHFKVVGHRIRPGKPELDGLPSLFADRKQAQTLTVQLKDDVTGLDLDLNYTVFKDSDVIIRSSRITNKGSEPIFIEKLASFSADFAPSDYRLLKLSGASVRERQEEFMDLKTGNINVSSRLGASGHEQNPFIALLEPGATETHGNVYGFSLVYSGSFSAEAEQNRNRYTRVVMGLNPMSLNWKLNPGESFQSPEAVGVFSGEGLGGMTRQLHSLFNNHLIRSTWKDKPRPIVMNTWEAFGPNIDHEKVVNMAKEAKDLGIELIVVDDGWFGEKYPRTGVDALGDWKVNTKKFPKGLKGLAEDINAQGMMMGIWMEPEMVSPNSELFEKHPDWIIGQPERTPSPVKHQYILDLGRPEVQDYLIDTISEVLDAGNIQYLKWDMNRTMTEIGSFHLPGDQQKETQHRYMLGLYRVLKVLTEKYPDVLFEGCAGGGGRFDPGMLQYFPQIWTSDNTDAGSRMNIQAGTARVYPPMTMTAHVSDVPNGQVGRTTSFKTRFHVAMAANLGLEMDPAHLSEDKKAFAKEQIAFYKQVRHLVQDGEYRQLRDTFTSNWPAWMFTATDGSEALVFAFQKMADVNVGIPALRLQGLDEKARYQVSGIEKPLTGAYLMNVGLVPRFSDDFDSNLFHIRRMD